MSRAFKSWPATIQGCTLSYRQMPDGSDEPVVIVHVRLVHEPDRPIPASMNRAEIIKHLSQLREQLRMIDHITAFRYRSNPQVPRLASELTARERAYADGFEDARTGQRPIRRAEFALRYANASTIPEGDLLDLYAAYTRGRNDFVLGRTTSV